MFKKEDFDHIDKMQNNMADGVMDASSSHSVLEEVIEILSQTDYLSDESRMEMMMHCVNICYSKDEDGDEILDEDRIFHLVLALCFNYSNVVSNLVIDGFNLEDYYRFLKEEVLPVMNEQSKTLPYWDIDEK